MQIDTDMLSVMIAAGEKMNIKIKQDTQTWTQPFGKDGKGNMGIIVRAGTVHAVVNARDGWIAIDVANRWIPLSPFVCEIIDDDPPPVDEPPAPEPPAMTRRVIEVDVIDGKQMFRIDGGEWQ